MAGADEGDPHGWFYPSVVRWVMPRWEVEITGLSE
jgi:hypothetical protein